jgi:ribonuclease HI
MTYQLNFDGSAKPNPGKLTSAYIIRDSDGNVVFSETIKGGDGSSNVAEYIGLFKGLQKAVELGCKHIKIIGDSELIIKQVRGEYRCNKPRLISYRDKIRDVLKEFHTSELIHVKRKYNKDADQMCRR